MSFCSVLLRLQLLSLTHLLFPQLHFEVPLSPVIAPKKARPAETGSDEVSVRGSGRGQTAFHDLDTFIIQYVEIIVTASTF